MRHRTLRVAPWPAALDGLRVALVSDLHAGGPHVTADAVHGLVERLNRLRPDLVCVLGDLADPAVLGGSPVPIEAVAERLGGLRTPLGVVAVLGNHDWIEDGPRAIRALHGVGIPVLENDAVRVGRGPQTLHVVGVADATTRAPDVTRALRTVPDNAPVILLSHDPDVFEKVPDRVALTVAGHTHGGQVDVPLLGRLIVSSHHARRYASGPVRETGRQLYVTTGVGTSRLPLRFLRPPEVVILRLRTRSTTRVLRRG